MATTAIPNKPETKDKKTTVGSYFVSNYPPFSFWSEENNPDVLDAIQRPPQEDKPIGLYMHIPFCRKRCHFCYFKVYTDKNAKDIRTYIDALQKEMSFYAGKPFIGGRKPKFVYFGGGTPSYISTKQLNELVGNLKEQWSWDEAEEVTFECEPGTLSGDKLKVIRDIGVTRLSFGVENFKDEILELNGRAHRSEEIYSRYEDAKALNFPQINIDLIAGMIGETEENWQKNVETAIEMEPEIITIYQMEVPFNTTIYQNMKNEGSDVAPVADWETKRRWVDEAFAEFEKKGYRITSGYSAVHKDTHDKFLYRDMLWHDADLLSLGVSSFSHIHSTHFQNQKDFVPYIEDVQAGKFPLRRSYTLSREEAMIREFILQLKLSNLDTTYFESKYGVNILDLFAAPLAQLRQEGVLYIEGKVIHLSDKGMLEIDSWLPHFFLPEHQDARYT